MVARPSNLLAIYEMVVREREGVLRLPESFFQVHESVNDQISRVTLNITAWVLVPFVFRGNVSSKNCQLKCLRSRQFGKVVAVIIGCRKIFALQKP